MARLTMRVVDSIWPGRRAARDVPLAELCNLLILAEADDRKAIPQPPQNPSAQPGTVASHKFNTEDLDHLAAEQSPENVYQRDMGRLDAGRAVPMLPPFVRLCLSAAIIVATSVSVFGVLALRPTAVKFATLYASFYAAHPGSTGTSVPSSDPSLAIRSVPAAVAATEHTLEYPGEPQSPERSPDTERTAVAAKPTATGRILEIARTTPATAQAAPPPAGTRAVPGDRSVPKLDAPALAKLEMPGNTSAGISASPDAAPPGAVPTSVAPTAVTPSSEPRAAPAETAALLVQGDSLFGVGVVTTARLFYERAADAGNGEAALRLGETYDPNFLEQARLRAVPGDAAAAVFWYRRALELGVAEAEILLKGIQTK
jgi:hypothetical protein